MNFISSGKTNILRASAESELNKLFLTRENKIHIFKPLCNFLLLLLLLLLCRQEC